MQYVNRNNFGQDANGVPLVPQPLPAQPQPQPEPEPQVQPQLQVQQQVVTPAEVPIAKVQEPPVQKAPSLPTQGTPLKEKIEQISFNKMEITSTDILNLYRDHNDIRRDVIETSADLRREGAVGFGDTKYAIAEHSESTNRDILTTGYHTQVKVDEAADKIQQRATDFYLAGQARDFDTSRDVAALKASVDMANQKLSTEILLSSERNAAATALESAKVAAAVALGQHTLSTQIAEGKYDTGLQIAAENEKTRDLINSLKGDELNRILIERNTDLTHCRHDYWGARDGLFNTQFAALSSQVNSQLNALNSQLTETRQGMVNFGSMAGNAGQQSSTSNNVR